MNIRLYIGILFLCFSPMAIACSCMDQKMPMIETLARNDLVFTGKVLKKSKEKWLNSEFYRVEFLLAENYKGVTGNHVSIKTGTDTAMCGFPFEEGESYVVFAYKFPEAEKDRSSAVPESNIQYGTGLCSKTKAIKYAAADLDELNNIKSKANKL